MKEKEKYIEVTKKVKAVECTFRLEKRSDYGLTKIAENRFVFPDSDGVPIRQFLKGIAEGSKVTVTITKQKE